MSNNKKKNSGAPHATQSYAQMMSQHQLNALKPYINDQVRQASQAVLQQIYSAVMQQSAMLQTRQLAFERLLKKNTTWFNEDILAIEIADVEDEAMQMEAVTAPVAAGDRVRLQVSVKQSGEENYGEPNKLLIHSLLTKGPGDKVQTYQDLEEALVGMTTGETREFVIPEVLEEGKEPENTLVKATIIRVSRKKENAHAA